MKNQFPFQPLALIAIAVFAVALIISGSHQEAPSMAQEQQGEVCEMGDIVLDTPVVCWAVDAVNFVIDNELFSVLTQDDVRDAVKHYRFYQLVVSELNS